MKKVLIIFGGKSYEHKISCNSCSSIFKNIDRIKYDVNTVVITEDNVWYKYLDDRNDLVNWKYHNIEKVENIISFIKNYDVVFPVMHGNNGEDGKLQGLFELFNIKYVGCNLISSAIGMDKAYSKLFFKSIHIPQVPYIIINKNYSIPSIVKNLSFPMIVKPSNGGSSIGIKKANNEEELDKAIKNALLFDNKIIVEKFIIARELECAVLKNKNTIISDVGEIISNAEFYDYEAKYINNISHVIIPASIDKKIKNKIRKYSNKVFTELGCNSLSRIDFLYDWKNNKLYLNEINTMPGFTEISMYPKLLKHVGYSYKDLISQLIESANQ